MTDAPALRTFLYAPPRSAGATPACLPAKTAFSRRFYDVDLSPLLRLLGQGAIAKAGATADAPLTLDAVSRNGSIVTFRLAGGAPGPAIATVCIALVFADGSREDVVLGQPIQVAPAAVAADPTDGGTALPAITDGSGNAITDELGLPLTAG